MCETGAEENWSEIVKDCPKGEPHHNAYTDMDGAAHALKEKIQAIAFATLSKDVDSPLSSMGAAPVDQETAAHIEVVVDKAVRHIMFFGQAVVRVQRKHSDPIRKSAGKPTKDSSSGTGILLVRGTDLLVMTNNHVVLNAREAEGAMVDCLYHRPPTSKGAVPEGVIRCHVTSIVTSSSRTSPENTRARPDQLDFVLLQIQVPENDDERETLQHIAIHFVSLFRLPYSFGLGSLDSTDLLVCFSHPHGHAKRISFGHPTGAESLRRHYHKVDQSLLHSVTTCKGSSGAPILMCRPLGYPGESVALIDWACVSLHFRSGISSSSLAIMWHLKVAGVLPDFLWPDLRFRVLQNIFTSMVPSESDVTQLSSQLIQKVVSDGYIVQQLDFLATMFNEPTIKDTAEKLQLSLQEFIRAHENVQNQLQVLQREMNLARTQAQQTQLLHQAEFFR